MMLMEDKCLHCGSWILCDAVQEGDTIPCPFCGNPTTLNDRKSQAGQKMDQGKVDFHIPVVLEPSGPTFVSGQELSASFSQGGRLLGLCGVSIGADGSIVIGAVGGKVDSDATKASDSEIGSDSIPEMARFAAITPEEEILFDNAMETLRVALNEANAGTRWPNAMVRIWGEPLPDDLLSTARTVAGDILEEFQQKSQFGAGKSYPLRDKTAHVFDPATGKLSSMPLLELNDEMMRVKVEGVGKVWVKSSQVSCLPAGPVLHPPLCDTLRQRIKECIMEPLLEVHPQTLDQWEDAFRRERNAEREIAVWLVISGRFMAFVNAHQLSKAQRKEVFQLMLRCTFVPNQAAFWATVNPKTLTREQVKAVIAPFENKWRG
jgi:hypothetical protein